MVGFKVLVLCFSYTGISRAFCGRVAGLQWRHIALTVIVFFAGVWVSGFGVSIGLGGDFLFCLCWVGVLFLSFSFMSYVLSECDGCVLPLILACSASALTWNAS